MLLGSMRIDVAGTAGERLLVFWFQAQPVVMSSFLRAVWRLSWAGSALSAAAIGSARNELMGSARNELPLNTGFQKA